MKNRIALLILLMIAASALTSCDDDGVSPESFSLKIVVRDTAGDPVEGLSLALAADIPFYGEKATPSKARVVIPFTAATACSLRVAVEDIEGNEIRELAADEVVAGRHRLSWTGTDFDDVHQASGYYVVHAVAKQLGSDVVLHDQRRPMYMAILSASRKSVGETDADGEIVLTDKRLFPYLYQAEDIPAVDETGQPFGTISFGASMRFHLVDLENGGAMKFFEDVDGSGTLNFVWDPIEGTPPEPPTIEPDLPAGTDPLDPTFELGRPFPVPFN